MKLSSAKTPKSIDANALKQHLSAGVAGADAQRSATSARMAMLGSARANVLAREAASVARSAGDKSDAAKKAADRAARAKRTADALDLHAKLATKAPVVPGDAWWVVGRITSTDGQSLAGYRVKLYVNDSELPNAQATPSDAMGR